MTDEPERLGDRRQALESKLAQMRTDLSRLVDLIDKGLPPTPSGQALAVAPVVAPELRAADELVAAIDKEVRRADGLLARVAQRERAVRTGGFPDLGPAHRVAEFTLYARPVHRGARVEYTYSIDPLAGAVPVPLPEGFRVVQDPKTGHPSLRPSSQPR